MSDRYYAQMGSHFNMKPWELEIALRDKKSNLFAQLERKAEGSSMTGKVTRKDIAKSINEMLETNLEVGKLPLLSLENIYKVLKSGKVTKVEVPTGRLKQPYYDAMQIALNTPMELSTITVKTMNEFLLVLNRKYNNE